MIDVLRAIGRTALVVIVVLGLAASLVAYIQQGRCEDACFAYGYAIGHWTAYEGCKCTDPEIMIPLKELE